MGDVVWGRKKKRRKKKKKEEGRRKKEKEGRKKNCGILSPMIQYALNHIDD